MADIKSSRQGPEAVIRNLHHSIDLACGYLQDYGVEQSEMDSVKELLLALAHYPEEASNPVVRSRMSMILHHHQWQYWYYDGIPLIVRVAYLAAVESDVINVPQDHVARWPDFVSHMAEIKARERTILHSELAGGWLYPGEPHVLWEIAKAACCLPGDFCELGTWTGRSATILCGAVRHFASQKKIFLADNWEWGYEKDVYPFMTEGRNPLLELEYQLKSYQGTYNVVRGMIVDALPKVRDALNNEKLAFLYHDAGHVYEQVINDLRAFLPLLRDGGYLLVHDYNNPELPGTKQAVDDLITEKCWGIACESVFNTLGVFRKCLTENQENIIIPRVWRTIGTDRSH